MLLFILVLNNSGGNGVAQVVIPTSPKLQSLSPPLPCWYLSWNNTVLNKFSNTCESNAGQ